MILTTAGAERFFDHSDGFLLSKVTFMKTAYLDAFSGLSGDMLVGALLDAGADFESLRAALRSLGVGGYELAIERRTVSGISAVKFNVNVSESQPERHLS